MSLFKNTIVKSGSERAIKDLAAVDKREKLTERIKFDRDRAFLAQEIISKESKDFSIDAEKSGYWCKVSCEGTSSKIELIPIQQSLQGIKKDYGEENRFIALSACFFRLTIAILPVASIQDVTKVTCTLEQSLPSHMVRTTMGEKFGSAGFFADQFFSNEISGLEYSHLVSSATSIDEIADKWREFTQTQLAQFLTDTLHIAEEQSLKIVGSATTDVANPLQPNRSLFGWFLKKSIA